MPALCVADVICVLCVLALAYTQSALDLSRTSVALLLTLIAILTVAELVLYLTIRAPLVDLLLAVDTAVLVGVRTIRCHIAWSANALLSVSEIHSEEA